MSEQPDTTALSEAERIEQIERWTIAESISSYAAAMDALMEEGK